MKKFFLSGFIVASVAVALAATHNDKKSESSKSTGRYGLYEGNNYQDTIPRDTSRKPGRDTVPRPDSPPHLRY